jgi:DNA polymerase-4
VADPIATTRTLTEIALELARVALADHPDEREVTLLAISVSNLVDQPARQLDLELGLDDERGSSGAGAGDELASSRWALDRAMDRVRARFGRAALGYAAVEFGHGRGAPDAFRELAQHDD